MHGTSHTQLSSSLARRAQQREAQALPGSEQRPAATVLLLGWELSQSPRAGAELRRRWLQRWLLGRQGSSLSSGEGSSSRQAKHRLWPPVTAGQPRRDCNVSRSLSSHCLPAPSDPNIPPQTRLQQFPQDFFSASRNKGNFQDIGKALKRSINSSHSLAIKWTGYLQGKKNF